jgi:hypothetical protein
MAGLKDKAVFGKTPLGEFTAQGIQGFSFEFLEQIDAAEGSFHGRDLMHASGFCPFQSPLNQLRLVANSIKAIWFHFQPTRILIF